MKQIHEPELRNAEKLTPQQLNEIRFNAAVTNETAAGSQPLPSDT